MRTIPGTQQLLESKSLSGFPSGMSSSLATGCARDHVCLGPDTPQSRQPAATHHQGAGAAVECGEGSSCSKGIECSSGSTTTSTLCLASLVQGAKARLSWASGKGGSDDFTVSRPSLDTTLWWPPWPSERGPFFSCGKCVLYGDSSTEVADGL